MSHGGAKAARPGIRAFAGLGGVYALGCTKPSQGLFELSLYGDGELRRENVANESRERDSEAATAATLN